MPRSRSRSRVVYRNVYRPQVALIQFQYGGIKKGVLMFVSFPSIIQSPVATLHTMSGQFPENLYNFIQFQFIEFREAPPPPSSTTTNAPVNKVAREAIVVFLYDFQVEPYIKCFFFHFCDVPF